MAWAHAHSVLAYSYVTLLHAPHRTTGRSTGASSGSGNSCVLALLRVLEAVSFIASNRQVVAWPQGKRCHLLLTCRRQVGCVASIYAYIAQGMRVLAHHAHARCRRGLENSILTR